MKVEEFFFSKLSTLLSVVESWEKKMFAVF